MADQKGPGGPVEKPIAANGNGQRQTPVASTDRLLKLCLLDRYRVLKLVGEGGMGKVYLADDLKGEGRGFLFKSKSHSVESEFRDRGIDVDGSEIAVLCQGSRKTAVIISASGRGYFIKRENGDVTVQGLSLVAVKFAHRVYNDKSLERFRREGEALRRLEHPNIVRILHAGVHEDREGVLPFLAMEYLKGKNLGNIIAEQMREIKRGNVPAGEGPLKYEIALHIADQVSDALAVVHDGHMIHRDLKPENIFIIYHLGDPNFAKVLDFGLVKGVEDSQGGESLTSTGAFIGSPEYMAPEQTEVKKEGRSDRDPRIDVYGLAACMYKMLTGRAPYEGNNPMAVLFSVKHEPIIPPSIRTPSIHIPQAVEELVLRGMQKEPEKRYPDIRSMRAEIKRLLGEPVPRLSEIQVNDLGSSPTIDTSSSPEYLASVRRPQIVSPGFAPESRKSEPPPTIKSAEEEKNAGTEASAVAAVSPPKQRMPAKRKRLVAAAIAAAVTVGAGIAGVQYGGSIMRAIRPHPSASASAVASPSAKPETSGKPADSKGKTTAQVQGMRQVLIKMDRTGIQIFLLGGNGERAKLLSPKNGMTPKSLTVSIPAGDQELVAKLGSVQQKVTVGTNDNEVTIAFGTGGGSSTTTATGEGTGHDMSRSPSQSPNADGGTTTAPSSAASSLPSNESASDAENP